MSDQIPKRRVSDHPEAVIELSVDQFEDMMVGAAKRGAREALTEIGLDDENAIEDVKALRGLLSVWRDARKTALQQVVKILTTALLGALTLGAAVQLGLIGGGNKP